LATSRRRCAIPDSSNQLAPLVPTSTPWAAGLIHRRPSIF
jgi:hypothetical protein